MMFKRSGLALAISMAISMTAKAAEPPKAAAPAPSSPAASVLDHKMKTIDGKEVDLSKYKGKVLLVVNVASKCGNTPQYKGLQTLHDEFNKQGLEVLGFPCNQFGKQEAGSDEQIAEFCKSNYAVTFDMFSKIDVNGENAAPLYKQLTSNPATSGKVGWNFEKFLIGKDGKVAGRFAPKTQPTDPKLVAAIKAELAK